MIQSYIKEKHYTLVLDQENNSKSESKFILGIEILFLFPGLQFIAQRYDSGYYYFYFSIWRCPFSIHYSKMQRTNNDLKKDRINVLFSLLKNFDLPIGFSFSGSSWLMSCQHKLFFSLKFRPFSRVLVDFCPKSLSNNILSRFCKMCHLYCLQTIFTSSTKEGIKYFVSK